MDGAYFCFCASREALIYCGRCILIQRIFTRLMITREKKIFATGIEIAKELGVTTHFSEIIMLEFRKRFDTCILNLFTIVI